MVAAAVGIGTAVSGIASAALQSSAAGSASGQQQQAADQASQVQQNMFNQEQQNLNPYIQSGASNLTALQQLTGTLPGGQFNPLNAPLTAAFQPTEAQLEATPGYQFNLTQGLKAVQNNATASGSGVSGNALAGAATYATGLADSTYQGQYNNYVTNQTNQYNRLLGLAQLGQNSAVNVGAQGNQVGANIGSNIIGAGNAGAAGTIGSANALTGGLSSLSSANSIYQFLNNSSNSGGGNINASTPYNSIDGDTAGVFNSQ